MYLFIIFGCLFNALLIGLFGRLLGRQAAIYCSILMLLLLCFIIIFLATEIIFNNNIILIKAYTLLLVEDIKLDISFLIDQLTVLMLLVIILISTFVHIFTGGYMSHDPFIVRFYTFLGIFTFFMIILVTSDNFLQLFVGWEGVGVCSYLLINFWYNRIAANKAAIKAMLMNRIADVFFIFAIVLVIYIFKTANYILIFSLIDNLVYYKIYILYKEFYYIDLILLFLFIGAIGKSAQIGLHTWLPDAMEGPTPVSALLHAATMVTAGVFLLIRCSFIFEKSDNILFLIVLFGSCTALLSALIAVYQYDIKKIIAYSTCSQLGYMFLSSGLSNYNISMFHLFNHAFFKALLFLGAGCIISCLFDEQDMRKMGGLIYKAPFTFISIFIGSLAILGFPFLTGFYSKDILLELTYISISLDYLFFYTLAVLTAFFTAIYSFKLIFFVFFIKTNVFNKKAFINENNIYILFSLFMLSLLSIFIGFLFSEIFTSLGILFLQKSIFYKFFNTNIMHTEFLHPVIKNLPFIFTLLGMASSFIFFIKNIFKKYFIINYNMKEYIYIFFFNAGFFNIIYNTIFISLYKNFYINFVRALEKGFFENYGPFGIYVYFRCLSLGFKYLSPFILTSSLFLMYFFMLFIIYFVITYSIMMVEFVYFVLLVYFLIYSKIKYKYKNINEF